MWVTLQEAIDEWGNDTTALSSVDRRNMSHYLLHFTKDADLIDTEEGNDTQKVTSKERKKHFW